MVRKYKAKVEAAPEIFGGGAGPAPPCPCFFLASAYLYTMGLLDYLQARVRSFGYAFRGVYFLLRDTPHARIHLLATAVVVALGLALEVSPVEWALLMLAMGLVWAAEGFNSALETLSDRVSTERHPLAGRAKDLAAGAVLLASIFAAAVGLLIFLPHLF